MKEFDCLEMIAQSYWNEDELSEEMYSKILYEEKAGWEHYLEYNMYVETGGYEANCGSIPYPNGLCEWQLIGRVRKKITGYMLGVNYINLNGYYEDKYYGLFMRLDDDSMKLYDYTMEITREPGLVLNRTLVLEELGI
jgi:hypothetical protein